MSASAQLSVVDPAAGPPPPAPAENALAEVNPRELLPPASAFRQMQAMADELFRSGLMPPAVRNPSATLAVMLKGRELGIPAMTAIEGIGIIQGKPTISPHLMLALIKRDHGGGAIRVEETTPQRCVVAYREPGWPDVKTYAYTWEMAERAGLTKGDNWRKYPDAMLRARCVSAVGKMAFPDVLGAMYAPGELGEAVEVTDDGDVVSAKASAPPPQGPKNGPPNDEGGDPALRTEAQSKRLWKAWRSIGQPDEKLRGLLRSLTGKESTKDLTVAEASTVIDAIDALADAFADEAGEEASAHPMTGEDESSHGLDTETGEILDAEVRELPGLAEAGESRQRRDWTA